MPDIDLRTLRQRLKIGVPEGAAFETLRFIDARPEIEGIPCDDAEASCRPLHGFLQLDLPSGAHLEGTAQYLLGELHLHHYWQTRREFAGCALIHGGTISAADRHILVVGDKGAGKTTLLLHLAAAGVSVAGDEHMVIDGLTGIPRPRTLRVKDSALGLLSTEVAAAVEACPSTQDWHGTRVFAVPPDQFGTRWIIRPAPISDIVFLEPNHGGRSALAPISANAALDRLFPGNVVLPDAGKVQALAGLRSLVTSARLWVLTNGKIDQSCGLVYELLKKFNTRGA